MAPDSEITRLDMWTPTLGATVLPGEGVRFRVWAPAADRVEVAFQTRGGVDHHPLAQISDDGEFAGVVTGIRAGARYRYRLNGGASYPDPCSRAQPEGPHGPSMVVDPAAFAWRDGDWPGLPIEGLVLYECHVGTATAAGTFDALIERLPELRALGVGALQLMPVAEFAGRRGWGYDAVNLYAPHHAYGGPEGLRRLVDAAHGAGLGVILDVLYNHLGAEGNYLRSFSPDYFRVSAPTRWGDAFNFDGRNSHRVREFIVGNAWRWIREFHVDGLRLDASQALEDRSDWHIIADIAARTRAAAYPRAIVISAESDANDPRLLGSPAEDGYGLEAVTSDDFHHALRARLTGERGGYQVDYEGTAAEIARAIQGGFLYQGERSTWTGQPRGAPVTDEPAAAFIFAIQNHDQVGNRPGGARLNTLISAAAYRAASALLLICPETPLLFMGQEFAASAPFCYFTDLPPALGWSVTEGRRRDAAAFGSEAAVDSCPDPQTPESFQRSKLNWRERESNAGVLALYSDLLALRRDDPVLRLQDRARMRASAPSPVSTLSADRGGDQHTVVALHRWSAEGERLALINLGPATRLRLADALAPDTPADGWNVLWHSNDRRYGGDDGPPLFHNWQVELAAESAALLSRLPRSGDPGGA